MAYEQYNDEVDYSDSDYDDEHWGSVVPARLAQDPTWCALQEVINAVGDEPQADLRVGAMLKHCQSVAIPEMQAHYHRERNPYRQRDLARGIKSLVHAILHIKNEAKYLLTPEMDEAILNSGKDALVQRLTKRWNRIEESYDATMLKMSKHAGSLLMSPWLLKRAEWKIRHEGRSVTFKDSHYPAGADLGFQYLSFLIDQAGRSCTASEIKAYQQGSAKPIEWSRQAEADGRYVREVAAAGESEYVRKISAMGSHERCFDDDATRGYDSVRKVMSRLLDRIDSVDTSLGWYFRRTLSTGAAFAFTDTTTDWMVG
jgi:hypothetical protein